MVVSDATIKQLTKEICELNDIPGSNPSDTEEFEVLEEVIAEADDVQSALNAAWQGVRSHSWHLQSARQAMLGAMASMQRRVQAVRRG